MPSSTITVAYYDDFLDDADNRRQKWEDTLRTYQPDVRLVDLEATDTADIALVWNPPNGRLKQIESLKLIVSLGQGVDHLLKDDNLPAVPIARLVDPDMSNTMSHWVIMVLLDYLRNGQQYRQLRQEKKFHKLPQRDVSDLKVAVYGVGAIGSVVANRLSALGFDVYGWSNQPKTDASFTSVTGEAGFNQLLGLADIHIGLLPLTSKTMNLFNADVFARMKNGAYFINAGRGKSVVENNLLQAIQMGHLDGAALDVFATEPLPPEHPFWDEPKITIYPHVSAMTNIRTSAKQIAEAIDSAINGLPVKNCVDLGREY